jgi:hypothetical protein
MKKIKRASIISFITILSVIFLVTAAIASPGTIDSASLKSGDYSNGKTVSKTAPWVEVPASSIGIIDSTEGITFTAPEAIINWQLNSTQQSAFRSHGTISFMFRADRETHVNGELFGDNYGFDQYRNGQSTFAIMAHRDNKGTPSDTSDDTLDIKWKTCDGSAWYYRDTVTIEYDQWYHLGFAWGDPATTDSGNIYETWVCSVRAGSDSVGTFPWGVSWGNGSAFNIGLGGHHERGYTSTSYGSATGVMFFDISIWDEYVTGGGTQPCDDGDDGDDQEEPSVVVGGDVSSLNKFSLLVPWISLVAFILLASGIILVVKRTRA